MTLLYTKNEKWLKRWDYFLVRHPKGNHLILSDWLKSYKSYGFDFEIGLATDKDEIVGGFGVVIAKFLFFRFYIIPHGILYSSDYLHLFETHISDIKRRSKERRCCYLQNSVPISSNQTISQQTYSPEDMPFLNRVLNKGKLFKYIYCSYGINWIQLEYNSKDEILNSLRSNTRRDIRAGRRKHDNFKFLTSTSEIKKDHQLCQENAKTQGYALRSWNDFQSTILELINNNIGHFIAAYKNNEIKGVVFIVKSGGYYTNILGGVKRETPNLLSGYALQWEAIKHALQSNHMGYNLSVGGSMGVRDFKSKFGAESIRYENPHYHYILKPIYFKLFQYFDTYLKRYKSKISKILSRLKG